MTAEEQLGQRVVDKDLHGIDGDHRQALLLEQARQLSPDPAVPYRVGIRQDNGSRCFLVRVVDDQGVPVEIEDDDPAAAAGNPGHLGERRPGIGEVFQQPCGAAHVERGVWERKRLHVPDLKGDGDLAFADASPGFSDHGLAGVDPDKAASRADDVHHVEHIGPRAAADFQDCGSWCQCHPLQHEPLARLALEAMEPGDPLVRRQVGWRGQPTTEVDLLDWFHRADVSVFACTHTGLPFAQDLADQQGRRRLVINNGSAGLPNFIGTGYGVITRLSADPQPPTDSLYGITIDGFRCDALALDFDVGWWKVTFAAQWPPGSPTCDRYLPRITDGGPLRLRQAIRGTVTQSAHNC